jgi:hypothetical protein
MNAPPSNNSSGGVPIFFKWVMLISVVTSIISTFTHLLILALANYPFYTVLYANIWRLFTCGLVSHGLLATIASCSIMYFIMPEIVPM